MQPVVHLAVGYLCYAAYTRYDSGEVPADTPALAALFGAALPDLIDKPLWLLGIVEVGRTFGHSLLFVVPIAIVAYVLAATRSRRTLGVAFVIGLFSHLATDIPWHALTGDFHELGFLFWPLTPMPPYTGTKALVTVAGIEVTTLWLEAVILLAGVALWVVDGCPGLNLLRERLYRGG